MSNIVNVPEGEDLDGLTRAEVQDLAVDEVDMEIAYDESLNEVYGPATVAGYTFETSDALRELDPIAYRVGFADYVSAYFQEVDLRDFPETIADDTEDDA